MIIRNVLAVIGLCTVAVHVVSGYRKYLHEPISDLLTEAADAEYERREREAFRHKDGPTPEPPASS